IAAGASERALDLDLERRTGELRTLYAILLLPLLLAAVGAASALSSAPAVIGAAVAAAIAWFLLQRRLRAPDRAVVGHDGLALTTNGQTRFIPYATLADVGSSGDLVVLALEDDTHLYASLLAPGSGPARAMAERRRDWLVARIREQLAAHRAGGEAN